MDALLLFLAILTLAFFVAFSVELTRGGRSIRSLKDVAPIDSSEAPRLSVLIAARDEERNIEEALQSILAQDYENFEVIVVNDRSSDRTGPILDAMAESSPRMRVVHVSELPKGWLGKNYALYRAAENASGRLLLFTDADVVMEPSVLRRGAAYIQKERFDHIAIGPEVKMPGALLNLFYGFFLLVFPLYSRPWKAKDPKSAQHIGIGAFNLLRADVYRSIGTHRAIAMRPDDDMKLGKLVKKNGYRQDFLQSGGLISVEWYSTVGELIRGLEKNAFAGVEYSVLAIAGGSVSLLLAFLWPFLGAFLTSGLTQLANIASALIIMWLYWGSAKASGGTGAYAPAVPIAVVLFIYILWNSMLKALKNGGIDWRGTHYPLSELKSNRV